MSARKIRASDTPVYDSWGNFAKDKLVFVNVDTWTCEDWINWHKAMVKAYGKSEANRRWVSAWLDGLSVVAGGRGTAPGSGQVFDSVPLACRTLNTAFRKYITARKPLYDAVYSGIGGAVTAPIGTAQDIVREGSRGVSQIPPWAWVVGGVAVAGIAAYLYLPKPRRR